MVQSRIHKQNKNSLILPFSLFRPLAYTFSMMLVSAFNLDEFLSLEHPESSQSLLIAQVDELLSKVKNTLM
jgi:hypothetical protein